VNFNIGSAQLQLCSAKPVEGVMIRQQLLTLAGKNTAILQGQTITHQ